jgi:hypothetical protein
MSQPENITFIDVVKKMKRNAMQRNFMVIFRHQDAIFKAEDHNHVTIDALTRSLQGMLPVTVIVNAQTSEITEAFLVA